MPRLAVLLLALAVSVARADELDDLGRCLAQKRATLYGASWCPQTTRQLEMIDAVLGDVNYVECSLSGRRGDTAEECRDAGVRSYPTWVFGDGSRVSGVQSLDALGRRARCSAGADPAPRGEGHTSERSTGGVRKRTIPGGPTIIEVR